MFIAGLFSSDTDDTSSKSPSDPTIISDGASIEGELELGSVNLRIEGHVEGDIDTDGRVVVAEGAEFEGTIHAGSVHLGGQIKGDVHAEEKIILSPSAEVHAILEADVLEIEAGADFSGTVVGEQNASAILDSASSDLDSLEYVPVPRSSRNGDGRSNPEEEHEE